MIENPILEMASSSPMDRRCHIYKQMWAPYCFDIKIGSERTDGRVEKTRKRDRKKGASVPREQVSHPMMDPEKFCILARDRYTLVKMSNF